jgi:hypothetical protein
MVFLTEMDGYQKMRDTNKNVIKMGVIIKGVYCILMLRKLFFTCLCFFLGFLGLQNFKAWRKLTFTQKKSYVASLQWFMNKSTLSLQQVYKYNFIYV